MALQCCYSFSQFTQEMNPVLATKKWNAHWIKYANSTSEYGVYHFRKKVELIKKPSKFIIHISADNKYWLFVNGNRVCMGPAKGDVTHWQFESLDIARYLKKGKNILAVVVWHQGDMRPIWQETYSTGLLVQGNTGAEEMVNTDTTWKAMENAAYTPIFGEYKFLGASEYFFAARYPAKWTEYDASEQVFSQAIVSEVAIPVGVTDNSKRRMVQRLIPLTEEVSQNFAKVRKMENMPLSENFIHGKGSLQINPWSKVKILVDQQYLTTAYPELMLGGGKGAKITLTYMEAPYINIEQDNKGNRNEINNKIVYGITDIIYPNGDSNFFYRPLYYRTFRYVEISIDNYLEPLFIHSFTSKFTAYPFKELASFESSDTSLKKIWETGWRTARLCAFDTYMDCPYHEQLQYVGDTRIQALISLYVSGDDRLMKNAITQFYDSRIDEGLTLSRYPTRFKQVIPPFSLFWTMMIHDHWMHKQDPDFAKQYLASIKEVLDWHKNKIDPKTGMLGALPFWNFVDWPKEWPSVDDEELRGLPVGAEKGNSSIHTLQFVYAIHKAVELFAAFGMDDVAREYTAIENSLKQSTYLLCWDEDKKMLASLPNKLEFSQHANTLAVLTNMANINYADLMRRTVADTNIVQCTVYYRFYLNQAMKIAGLGNSYVSMLTPWRNMLAIGLTTFAEKPEPSRSDCHAWSASPNYDLLATVLGVTPGSAGFKMVVIAPNLGGLDFAKGIMPHPQGMIEVNVKKMASGGVEAILTLPDNTAGEFWWNGEKISLHAGKQTIKR